MDWRRVALWIGVAAVAVAAVLLIARVAIMAFADKSAHRAAVLPAMRGAIEADIRAAPVAAAAGDRPRDAVLNSAVLPRPLPRT